jgi:hypothetical protein
MPADVWTMTTDSLRNVKGRFSESGDRVERLSGMPGALREDLVHLGSASWSSTN